MALVPDRLRHVVAALESAMAEVHAGDLSPATANAMANLARAIVVTVTAGEMEARLRALEAADRRMDA